MPGGGKIKDVGIEHIKGKGVPLYQTRVNEKDKLFERGDSPRILYRRGREKEITRFRVDQGKN